ncbi:MAG: ABC transporter ATP-binding protein [Candidatus Aminicenantes bacterium]|nr:MAG: ABC transporter ATP-binding protein [Candidatus Aminicenantes bacterium]
MASISIHNLSKSFGRVNVLRDVSLDIQDKEFIVLLGPSGCGKTTLLNIIAGLERQTSGKIYIAGVDMSNHSPGERDIGFVFQNYALYPNKTVYENLAFGLKFKKAGAPEFDEYRDESRSQSKKALADRRVKDIARILQIHKLLNSKPGQLSGGQKQRVAMGRAMVRKPKVYLFDEPLSNLDAILRVSMREEIKDIHNKVETTIVYVTHDQVEAMTLADRIVVLDKGIVQQVGTPLNIYDSPANVFVASFVGNPPMNLIPTKIFQKNRRLCFSLNETATPFPAVVEDDYRHLRDKEVIFGIRPEDISLRDCFSLDCQVKAEIGKQEFMGNSTLIHSKVGNSKLTLLAGDEDMTQPGKVVKLFLNMTKVHLYDAASGEHLLVKYN